jgi:hypothetical protein
VNALGLIIFISGPHSGRNTDRKLWNESVFGETICKLLSPGEFIIADGGFIGPSQHILVPHKAPQINSAPPELKKEMLLFNEELTMNRSQVEHIIHVLKNRAQSLASRYPRDRERQSKLLYASARLANRIKRLRLEHQLSKLIK